MTEGSHRQSTESQKYMAGVTNLMFVGRVKRVIPFKEKNLDDQFFINWYNERLGSRDSFNRDTAKYGLAQANHEAGFKSMRKYDRDQPEVDELLFQTACDWARKHFLVCGDSDIVTHDEAVEAMTKTASVGYPITNIPMEQYDNKVYKKSSKGYWLGIKGNDDILRHYYDDVLIVPYAPPTFWSNNLKREIRLDDKIKDNKIRTFVSPNILHIYAALRFFCNMNDKFYASAGKTWSQVGASPFKGEFDRLFRRLNKHPNAFELDESEYDSSLFRLLMFFMRDFRWESLKPRFRTANNRNRLWNLYRDIVESWIVTTCGDVFVKNTGNPSGSLNTIMDNTIILFVLLAYAWLKLAPINLRTYFDFMTNVEAALNGDDNTWTCSDLVVSWFNGKSVSDVWSGIGVTTKYGAEGPRKLETCKFLSCNFKYIPEFYSWVPVPEHEKVLAAMGRNSSDAGNPLFSLLRACALRIQSFWDEKTRALLHEYITFLIGKYRGWMNTSKDEPLFTFETVMTVYKTDLEIVRLFTAQEKLSGSDLNYDYLKVFDMCGVYLDLSAKPGMREGIEENPGESFANLQHLRTMNGITGRKGNDVNGHPFVETDMQKRHRKDEEYVTVNPFDEGGINPLGYVGKPIVDLLAKPFNKAVGAVVDYFVPQSELNENRRLKLESLARRDALFALEHPVASADIKKEKNFSKESGWKGNGKKGKSSPEKKAERKVFKKLRRDEKKIVKKAFRANKGTVSGGFSLRKNKPGNISKQLQKLGVTMKNPVIVPKSNFNMKMGLGGVELSGTDIVTSNLSNPAAAANSGYVIFQQVLNPVSMAFPRLSQIAKFYAKFVFVSVVYSIHPALSSTQTGSVIGGFDPDITDLAATSTQSADVYDDNFRDLAAHLKSKAQNYNQRSLIWKMPKLPNFPAKDGYFVSNLSRDATFVNQCLFKIEVAVPYASALPLGPLYCRWRIKLWDPQTHVPQSVSSGSSCLSIFQGKTSIGGTLTGAVPWYPIPNTPLSSYIQHNDGGVTLRANLLSTAYGLTFGANACYYLLLHATGTGIAANTFTYGYVGNGWSGVTLPLMALKMSATTSTTQAMWLYAFDLTTAAGNPQFGANSVDMVITSGSTTITAYSATIFSDPDMFDATGIFKSSLEKRIFELENKSKPLQHLYVTEEEEKEGKVVLKKLRPKNLSFWVPENGPNSLPERKIEQIRDDEFVDVRNRWVDDRDIEDLPSPMHCEPVLTSGGVLDQVSTLRRAVQKQRSLEGSQGFRRYFPGPEKKE